MTPDTLICLALFALMLTLWLWWACRTEPHHPDDPTRGDDEGGIPAGICGGCWQVLRWGDSHTCPDPTRGGAR